MAKVSHNSQRKADHLRINLEEDVRSGLTSGLERYQFVHEALPEIDLEAVDLTQELFGKHLRVPVLISSMTGGTPEAVEVNMRLAEAAQEAGVAMGLGSQRAALESPEHIPGYQVRRVAPDILLFANLGAVQLNYGYALEQAQRAVDMVQADGLFLHLNPLQEALQAGGDTRFASLAGRIEAICRALPVPVIAKEVGWGISSRSARLLANCGVAAIDVAGAGGTSWSQVEMHRAPSEHERRLAGSFAAWGLPTAESLRLVHAELPGMVLFGSGGLQDGIDIAKCIALGASLGGLAGPFLRAASVSLAEVRSLLRLLEAQLRTTLFAAAIPDLAHLHDHPGLRSATGS